MERLKAVCPNGCKGNEFTTKVEAVEEWLVDAYGNHLETLGNVDIVEGPRTYNTWECAVCGSAANFEKELVLTSPRKKIKKNRKS